MKAREGRLRLETLYGKSLAVTPGLKASFDTVRPLP